MRVLENPDDHGIYSLNVAQSLNPDYSIIGSIALVDADLLGGGTRHPNLVIMKLSSYFKRNRCVVRLIENYNELVSIGGEKDYSGISKYDAVFISKVFDFTNIDRNILNYENVFFGGTGFFFDHSPELPYDIEHCMPDYHIYDEYISHDTSHKKQKSYWHDYQDFSIGFATRGCFRKCKFCVNQNKNRVEFHSHISEWLDKDRKSIYLWDDNILGAPCWRQVFDELEETGKPYRFRQGMDIRLMTDEKAEFLSKSHYLGDFIFAFDNLCESQIIENKLKLWRQYTNKQTTFYVLVGFESQGIEEIVSAFKRIEILIKYGCIPYIMKHEKYLNSPYKDMFVQIARWCNQIRYFKKKSFREYMYLCQSLIKTDGFISKPLRTMIDFEQKHPDIANKYFDMKFSEQQYVIEHKK